MRENTKKLTTLGLVAALYAVITLALSGISYGPIQFRMAEVMVLLPLLGKEYILALTIGCFLANVIGPYGVPDIIFGTLATFISTYLVYLTGKTMKDKKGHLLIASLWPTIVNAIIVGIMLNKFFGAPLILSMLQVGFGQFVVITIIGVPLFNMIEKKYGKKLKSLL
ncbi:QueT transporter family protein [Clostridium sp. CCUG 7971]|uniref:QueT transporter family protein n=1 Tax=Clostridium sp. CCUG 7971 TaxID=2811414 RepID=UPI001ABBAF83|nr:QueT transporter family protein [Clostridium sp. CCUG 7971]MBO3443133.1 QueT transporter family protein [Clostridium sp. CCUG 7971]